MRAVCVSPSPGSTATRASRPVAMAPTVAPSTSTRADETRWIKAIMHGPRSGRAKLKPGTAARESAPPGLHDVRPRAGHSFTLQGMRADVYLFYWSMRLLSWLPLRAVHALGAGMGTLLLWCHSKSAGHMDANLRIVRPDDSAAEHRRLLRA